MKETPTEPTFKKTEIACVFIFCVGMFQMVGYIAGVDVLRGLGAASTISPFPKVFSDADGLETFASKFTIEFKHDDKPSDFVEITPELYSQLKGPYKRRNVYGAALSYGPRLPDALWQPVFCYGFAGPLLEELNLPTQFDSLQLHIETKTQGRDDVWIMEASCLE